MEKEVRSYLIKGSKKDLDTLEKFLRHAEYLGSIGASRNLLLRVDGDGCGQIQVRKANGNEINQIDHEHYNTKQTPGQGALVGTYDIG